MRAAEHAIQLKTHFLYTDEQGKFHQVALGFLPYVPRVGEVVMFIAQDRESNLWGQVATFTVQQVKYECFGMTLPVSQTWETVTGIDGAFQVILWVTPNDDEITWAYVQRVIEAEEGNGL